MKFISISSSNKSFKTNCNGKSSIVQKSCRNQTILCLFVILCFTATIMTYHLYIKILGSLEKNEQYDGGADSKLNYQEEEHVSQDLYASLSSVDKIGTVEFGPKMEIWDSSTTSSSSYSASVVWQIPPIISDVLGIVLLLHACTHDATKFFVPSPGCPNCVGLSEEVLVAKAFLNSGIAVIALTSQDRKSGCWSFKNDGQIAMDVLVEYEKKITTLLLASLSSDKRPQDQDHLNQRPFHSLLRLVYGASSGGAFAEQLVSAAATTTKLKTAGNVSFHLDGVFSQVPPPNHHPISVTVPIAVTTMTRDKRSTESASMAVKRWADQEKTGISPSKYRHDLCNPLMVTDTMLSNRVPNLFNDTHRAKKIVEALQQHGHIDVQGNLLRDPTRSNWRDAITGLHLGLELKAGRSPLAKALHRAWAFHEYCSDVIVEQLDWLTKNAILP